MIYRKRGRVARWEHGRVIVVSEAGEAIEEKGVFEVRPLILNEPEGEGCRGEGPDFPEDGIASDDVARIARDVRRHRPERLIVSHGIAEHEYNGVRWQDETRRVHVSLTRKSIRVLIDRADFDLDPIERVASALGRAGAERDAPARIRLAPNVAAALLPSLVGVAPPNVELWQTGGGLDGNGEAIDEFRVETAAAAWPNVFRPTYRFRPVRMPLNLRLECEVDVIDREIPEAIALLAPVSGLILRVLVVDRRRVYPATIRVTRIDAVAGERSWYPYGAGAFGSEIML
jgi:hypothetical protein